jgi:hypothetical protein
MAHVGGGAGDKVIDRQYIPAAVNEVVAKVRPEKSRASGDYRAQRVDLSIPVLSR